MNYYKLLLAVMIVILVLQGCDLVNQTKKDSKLPEEILGYQLTVYNKEVTYNPSDLYVPSSAVYRFKDEETIIGQGSDDASPLPTEEWDWSSSGQGEEIGTAVLFLDYGFNGTELYTFYWNGDEKDIKKRQTFEYTAMLGNSRRVDVTGYYEIEKF